MMLSCLLRTRYATVPSFTPATRQVHALPPRRTARSGDSARPRRPRTTFVERQAARKDNWISSGAVFFSSGYAVLDLALRRARCHAGSIHRRRRLSRVHLRVAESGSSISVGYRVRDGSGLLLQYAFILPGFGERPRDTGWLSPSASPPESASAPAGSRAPPAAVSSAAPPSIRTAIYPASARSWTSSTRRAHQTSSRARPRSSSASSRTRARAFAAPR